MNHTKRFSLIPRFASLTLILLSWFFFGGAGGCGSGGTTSGGGDGIPTGAICSNNKAEGSEACDGTDLKGETCSSLHFSSGTLTCATDCKSFNTSGCTTTVGACSNGVINVGEECDGEALGGQTCASQGFLSGSLKCDSQCVFDTSSCLSTACGNEMIDAGEECDGSKLPSKTCSDFGYSKGALTCDAGCQVVSSGCFDTPGETQWVKMVRLGDPFSYTQISSSTETSSGELVLTGKLTLPQALFDGQTLVNNSDPTLGTQDAFVAKLKPDGSLAWGTLIGDDTGKVDVPSDSTHTDTSGNISISGRFSGSKLSVANLTIQKPDPQDSSQDGFLAKVNPDGSAAWLIGIHGTSSDLIEEVLPAPSGAVYISGSFSSPQITVGALVLTNQAPAGSFNGFLAKINPDGTLAWLQGATGGDNTYCHLANLDSSENLYLQGEFDGPSAAFGGQTFSNMNPAGGTSNSFIAKVNPSGALTWAVSVRSSKNTKILSLLTDSSDYAYLTGTYSGPTLFIENQPQSKTVLNYDVAGNSQDAFVARIQPDGSPDWLLPISGPALTSVNTLALDSSTALYISGIFSGSTVSLGNGQSLTNTDVGLDGFLAKIDPSTGGVSWVRQAAGPKTTTFSNHWGEPSGGVYFEGSFFGKTMTLGGQTLNNIDPSETTRDAFFGRFDSDGNLKWISQLSSTSASASGEAFVSSVGPSGDLLVIASMGKAAQLTFGNTQFNDSVPSIEDVIVLKVHPDGSKAWTSQIVDMGGLPAHSSESSRGIYIHSPYRDTLSVGGKTATNPPAQADAYDMFLAKIAP